jgi:hypothetical protein
MTLKTKTHSLPVPFWAVTALSHMRRDSIALCDYIFKVACKMWVYITAWSQCLWPASQNGCDVWIYVISQPFLTSWAVGADRLMLREWTFKLCFGCATHEVVVICHLLCIISQPALMSGTQSHTQPEGPAVFSLSLNVYWIMIAGTKCKRSEAEYRALILWYECWISCLRRHYIMWTRV